MSENLFCAVAQAKFDSTVALIESGISVPMVALRTMKSVFYSFNNLVLMVADQKLTLLENYLLQLYRMNSGLLDENKTQFCRTAYACVAVMETLFPPGGLPEDDPPYVQMIPVDVRNQLRQGTQDQYQLFDNYVCKLSLIALLDGWKTDALTTINEQLEEIISLLTDRLDEAMEEYFAAVSPFLSLLDDLQKFANCGFQACNMIATAQNKEEEVGDKIMMERQGSSWVLKLTDDLNAILSKEDEIRSRISAIQTRLANPVPTPNYDSPSIDNVMRL
jgi:hypothetical protein